VNGITLNLCTGSVTVDFDPVVGRRQKVVLLLNEINPASNLAPKDYRFEVPARDKPTDPETVSQLTIAVSAIREGQYLVRVQVDGAESPLQVDLNSSNPTFNQYIGPQVSII
jgi:hypothetical protein